MKAIESFPPVIDNNSKILILGSMPGKRSLDKQKYYANSRNHFWKIIYTLFNEPIDEDYNKRLKFIKSKGIALWDVIKTCDRDGSLDTNIRKEKPNDFTELLTIYANINWIFFNGTKAYSTFKKHLGFDFSNRSFKQLPSTSPANTMTFQNKLLKWKTIKECLDDRQ